MVLMAVLVAPVVAQNSDELQARDLELFDAVLAYLSKQALQDTPDTELSICLSRRVREYGLYGRPRWEHDSQWLDEKIENKEVVALTSSGSFICPGGSLFVVLAKPKVGEGDLVEVMVFSSLMKQSGGGAEVMLGTSLWSYFLRGPEWKVVREKVIFES